jgi:hypothetical protein
VYQQRRFTDAGTILILREGRRLACEFGGKRERDYEIMRGAISETLPFLFFIHFSPLMYTYYDIMTVLVGYPGR